MLVGREGFVDYLGAKTDSKAACPTAVVPFVMCVARYEAG